MCALDLPARLIRVIFAAKKRGEEIGRPSKKKQIPGNGGSQELFGPMFPWFCLFSLSFQWEEVQKFPGTLFLGTFFSLILGGFSPCEKKEGKKSAAKSAKESGDSKTRTCKKSAVSRNDPARRICSFNRRCCAHIPTSLPLSWKLFHPTARFGTYKWKTIEQPTPVTLCKDWEKGWIPQGVSLQ